MDILKAANDITEHFNDKKSGQEAMERYGIHRRLNRLVTPLWTPCLDAIAKLMPKMSHRFSTYELCSVQVKMDPLEGSKETIHQFSAKEIYSKP